MAKIKGQFKKGGGRIGDGKTNGKRSTSVAKKKGFRRSKKTTLPIGLLAGLAPGATRVLATFQASGPQVAANEALAIYSGYDPTTQSFSMGNLSFGLMPLLIGWGLHKFVGGGLGINRALAQARVPLIRL